MISNVEQTVGYFGSPTHIDLDLSKEEMNDEKIFGKLEFSKIFGNTVFLFDDLHIACIINADMLFLYNVSINSNFKCLNQIKWRLPTIDPLFTIKLPFDLSCKCHLFYNKNLSILTISISSYGGLFYMINLSFSTCSNKYIFNLKTTFCFSTGISNILCINQISPNFFLIGSESGVFILTVNLNEVNKNNFPLFSTKKICEDIKSMVSNIVFIAKTQEDNNQYFKILYFAIFFEQSRDLSLLMLTLDNKCERQINFEIIDRISNITSETNIYSYSKLCFSEIKKICILLVNNTIYFYRLLNLGSESYYKKNIKFELIKTKEFLNLSNIKESEQILFPSQLYCINSEVYFARAFWYNEQNLESHSLNYFPIYEVYKINLDNFSLNDDFFSFGDINENEMIIWSNSFQNFWEDMIFKKNLYFSEVMNERNTQTTLKKLLEFFENKLHDLCPSKLIFNLTLRKYKCILQQFIESIVDLQFRNSYLETLKFISENEPLICFIVGLSTYFIQNIYINYGIHELIFDEKIVIKTIEFLKLFFLLINYFKRINSCYIHFLSDGNKIMLLSPVSFSIIEDFSNEFESNEFINNKNETLRLRLSCKFLGIFLYTNYLFIKMVLIRTKRIYMRDYLNKLFFFEYRRSNCEYLVSFFSTTLGILKTTKKRLKNNLSLDFLNENEYYHFDFGDLSINTSTSNLEENSLLETLDLKSLLWFNFEEIEDFILETVIFLSSIIINYEISKFSNAVFIYKEYFNIGTFNKELDFRGLMTKSEVISEIKLIEYVKLNRIRMILMLYFINIQNIYNLFSWLIFYRKFGVAVSQSYNLNEISLFYILDNKGSIFNFGKPLSANRKYILCGGGPKKVKYLSSTNKNFNMNEMIKILSLLLQKCVRVKLINDFFFSNVLLSNSLIRSCINNYIFSNCLFWDSFIYSTSKFFILNKNLMDDESFNVVNILIEYFENQIIFGYGGNYETESEYYFYYINLLFYRNSLEKNAILILDRLFDNVVLIENLSVIIRSELNINDCEVTIDFLHINNESKKIIFHILLLKLKQKSLAYICNFQLYIYLLRQVINLILIEIQKDIPDEYNILLKSYLRNHLIQFIYLYGNYGVKTDDFVKVIKDCLLVISTNFDKMLLLTVLWISFYYLSDQKLSNNTLIFSEIFENTFEKEILFHFHSFLMSIFWNEKIFFDFEFPSNSFLSVSMITNEFSGIRYEIYKFLIFSWEKENKYRDIAILAYLFSLKKYYELISNDNINNSLFPQEWIYKCSEDFTIIHSEVFSQADIVEIFVEIFKALKYVTPSKIYNFPRRSLFSDKINCIIYSLNTYIKYIGNFYNSNELFFFDDKPICISRYFYSLELPPIIFESEATETSNLLVTYLPSVPYVLYLKWHFSGLLKVLVSATMDSFNISSKYNTTFGIYFRYFKEILSKNEIYFESNGKSIEDHFNKKDSDYYLKLSTIELVYNLAINGYCKTVFRLIDLVTRIQSKYKNIYSFYHTTDSIDNCLTLNNKFLPNFLSKLCKTFGFWAFSCCFFLMSDPKQLINMINFNFENYFQTRDFRKKKKYEHANHFFALTCLEELLLQNLNVRGLDPFNKNINKKFGAIVNVWSSVLDYLYSSPFYFQGFCLSFLINEYIYKFYLSSCSNIKLNSFESIVPSEVVYFNEYPEVLIFQKQTYVPNFNYSIHSLTRIIENLAHFNYLEKAINIISRVVSTENPGFKFPIIVLLKIKFMIRSSDIPNKDLLSNRLEHLINGGILLDKLC